MTMNFQKLKSNQYSKKYYEIKLIQIRITWYEYSIGDSPHHIQKKSPPSPQNKLLPSSTFFRFSRVKLCFTYEYLYYAGNIPLTRNQSQ